MKTPYRPPTPHIEATPHTHTPPLLYPTQIPHKPDLATSDIYKYSDIVFFEGRLCITSKAVKRPPQIIMLSTPVSKDNWLRERYLDVE